MTGRNSPPAKLQKVVRLTLPLPPSVNSMYRAVGRRDSAIVTKSSKARLYEQDAGNIILAQGRPKVPDGPLSVSIVYHLPDAKKRDVDNLQKAVIDVLSRVLGFDDSVIVDLHAYKRIDRGDPRCEVSIRSSGASSA